jgi:intracellular sulfur oxidation DsrE/DsrF family protein
MKGFFQNITRLAVVCICIGLAIPSFSSQYNDSDALTETTKAKSLFDINLADASKLELYLSVIKMTREDLIRQGVTPDIVIAFRGASVRLINTETWSFSEEDQQSLEKSALILKDLQELGVKLEACSIATNLFKVDNSTILPGIKVVGNTFVSLTGYQQKGFALIPIQ